MHEKRYDFLKIVGKGGQGKVYLAWDQQNSQYVCIKKIRLPAIEEKRGIKKLNLLHHSGFVKTIDTFEDDTYFYHVMPYIQGISLLFLKNKLNPSKTRKIGLALIEMIKELDQHQITFNDIKPDNIIVEKSGKVRLIDYGAILNVEDMTSKRYGSIFFSAPEYLNKQPCYWQADLYSIGKCLNFVCRRGFLLRMWIKKATRIKKEDRFKTIHEAYQSLKSDALKLKFAIIFSCFLLIFTSIMQTWTFQKVYQTKDAIKLLCLDSYFQEGYELLLKDVMTKESFVFLETINGFEKMEEPLQKRFIDVLLKNEGEWIWQIQKRWYKHANYLDRYQLLNEFSISYLSNHSQIQELNFYFKYLFYLQKEEYYNPSFKILEKKEDVDDKVKIKWCIELAYRMRNSELLYEIYDNCEKAYEKATILFYLFQLGNYQGNLLHQALDLISHLPSSDLYKRIQKEINQWGEKA